VSLASAGRLFLKQPSILHKSSSLLQQRIAALQALPGVGQQRAVDVVTAFPALLNLQPEVLQERWRLLQQV
jgi:recombinational DNA repair protein RecR